MLVNLLLLCLLVILIALAAIVIKPELMSKWQGKFTPDELPEEEPSEPKDDP